MWIKPIGKEIICKPNTLARTRLKTLTGNYYGIQLNVNFLSLYERDVFTNYLDLKNIATHIDVVIFTGYAGCGHYAPARALALEYSNRGFNVIIVDPLFMKYRKTAILNCWTWKMVARYSHTLWNITRELTATKIGSDIILGGFKNIVSDELTFFLNLHKPSIILSTYTYTDAVMSKFNEYTKCLGVVVPDLNPIGFMSEIYHDTKNIHYFISTQNGYDLGIKLYPYAACNAGVHIMGNTPNFLGSPLTLKNYDKDILLFIPGSGLGIGKGFNALKDILNAWSGYTIVVCGDNQNWLDKATKIASYNSKLIPLGYVSYDILKDLFSNAKIVIGKSGGSMSVEMASIRGCKIIYAPIAGQEIENAIHYSNLGCITYARNKSELIEYITNRPYTKSIYDLKDEQVKKNSTKFVVDTTINIITKK